MTDLRDKQPTSRDVDLTRETSGNHIYQVRIVTWPYSGVNKEDVYSEKVIFEIRAMDFNGAHEIARCLATAISLAHDVWQSNVTGIWQK